MNTIAELADRFEKKLSLAQEVTQLGTTELFFDSENNQQAFANAIQNPNGSVFKELNNCFSKTEKPCGFDLKITANPGSGASWELIVNPPSLTKNIKSALELEFQKIMHENMTSRKNKADSLAKKSGGSGTLNVGSLALD